MLFEVVLDTVLKAEGCDATPKGCWEDALLSPPKTDGPPPNTDGVAPKIFAVGAEAELFPKILLPAVEPNGLLGFAPNALLLVDGVDMLLIFVNGLFGLDAPN